MFKLASHDHAIEYTVGFFTISRQWLGRLLGGSAMMATFQGDVRRTTNCMFLKITQPAQVDVTTFILHNM